MHRSAPLLCLAAALAFGTLAQAADRSSVDLGPPEQRIHIGVRHSFSKEEATARVGYLFDYWHRRFGVASVWQGNQAWISGRVFGLDIQARLEVTEDRVQGEAKDPGWLMRGRAADYIRKKLLKYMHPRYEEP